MAEYYRHSGIVPISGLIQTSLAGLGSALSLGLAYGYASAWMPFIYANFLLTAGFGFIVGWLIYRAARAGRVRNSLVPAVIGLVSSLTGLYFAWAGDLYARAGLPQNASVFYALDPRVMASYMEWFYTNGAWGIGKNGGNVTGLFLGAVWLTEAGVIVGIATLYPWSEISDWVFCEKCGWWDTIETCPQRLSVDGSGTLIERLKADDLTALGTAAMADPHESTYLQLKLATCPTCEECNYLDLERVTVTVDKEGKASTKTENLIKKLELTAADVPFVRAAGQAPVGATLGELSPDPAVSPEG